MCSRKNLAVVSVLAILGAIATPVSATLPGSNAELDQLYNQARRLLDESNERSLAAALVLLDTILERDPEYAGAYVERARLVLKSTFVGKDGIRDQFTNEGLQIARANLDFAIALEPTFADAYVLYGYLCSSMGLYSLGLAALDEADRLGSSSEWLRLNRAHIFELLARNDLATIDYLAAIELTDRRSNEAVAAREGVLRVGNSFEDMNESYLALLELGPTDAEFRDRYSRFLLRFGMFDEAIEQAQRAQSLNGGKLNSAVLQLALYAKAGDYLINRGDRVRASLYYNEALHDRTYPPTRAFLDSYISESTLIAAEGLIEFGVDVNATAPLGDTLLLRAVHSRSDAFVQALLARGANPNIADQGGDTPLAAASQIGRSVALQMLLDAGADPNFVPEGTIAPFNLAIRNDDEEIIRVLENAGGRRILSAAEQLAELIRLGNETETNEAIRTLEAGDPISNRVIGTLQDRFVDDPDGFFALIGDQARAASEICRHARSSATTATDELLRESVQHISQNPGIPRTVLFSCARSRQRADLRGPTIEVPEAPTWRESVALVEALRTAIDATDPDHARLSELRRAAEELVRANADDWQAHYVQAVIESFPSEMDIGPTTDGFLPRRLDAATNRLEETLRLTADSAEAYALYAHLLMRQGHDGIANVMLATAESLDEDYPWLRVYRADQLFVRGEYLRAEQQLAPVLDSTTSRRLAVAVRSRLVNIHTATASFEEARQMLDDLAKLAPDDQILARRRLEYFLFDDRDFSRAAALAYADRDRGGFQDMLALRALAMFAYAAELYDENGPTDLVQHWSEQARFVGADPTTIELIATEDSTIVEALESLQDGGLGIEAQDEPGNRQL